ncbi:hypothetical protein D9758_009119 [Tetrapyrgos nigripes]|uniref:Uncharacterized protein n=1 Tax=Tetrapyrgos nigripes TaxID=182062 RepID=A0A8H5G8L1_9AGAR|nr:hypothetical protein D9758_009119 [Tetrapyrgos nigripes]
MVGCVYILPLKVSASPPSCPSPVVLLLTFSFSTKTHHDSYRLPCTSPYIQHFELCSTFASNALNE